MKKEEVIVKIVDIEPFTNDTWRGFRIIWTGNIGFGEYTIYRDQESEEWHGDSECMDTNDDKWFLDLLFQKMKESIIVD